MNDAARRSSPLPLSPVAATGLLAALLFTAASCRIDTSVGASLKGSGGSGGGIALAGTGGNASTGGHPGAGGNTATGAGGSGAAGSKGAIDASTDRPRDPGDAGRRDAPNPVDANAPREGGALADGGVGGDAGTGAAVWDAVFNLGPPLSQDPYQGVPVAAYSAGGDAFVAYLDWSAQVSSGISIRRYRAATGAFEAPVVVDANGYQYVHIGADDAGDAIVAYVDNTYNFRDRRFSASGGGSWSAIETLQAVAASDDNSLLTSLEMTPGGHAVAAGYYPAGTTTRPFMRVFEAGRGWYTVQNVFPGLSPGQIFAGIAERGSTLQIATAALVRDPTYAGNLSAIYGNSYTYDLGTHVATAGSPAPVAPGASRLDQFPTSLVMDGTGTAWVLGNQFTSASPDAGHPLDSTFSMVLGQFTNGAWSTAAVVGNPPAARAPAVAVNRKGEALEAWLQCVVTDPESNPSMCTMRGRRYVGGAWQADVPMTDNILSESDGPVLALDGQGHALALWLSYVAGTAVVVATELDPATGWSPPHTLDQASGHNSGIADLGVTFGPDGSALATWTTSTQDAATNDIFSTVRAAFCHFTTP